MKRRIYVASSWRNEQQPEVVRALRAAGHEVYDFKDSGSFHWSEIDPGWQNWTADRFIANLNHPLARAGFATDFAAMLRCEFFVLVMPCGRSAHLEAGWAVGAGKTLVILLSDGEPELMYRLAITANGCIRSSIREVVEWMGPKLT